MTGPRFSDSPDGNAFGERLAGELTRQVTDLAMQRLQRRGAGRITEAAPSPGVPQDSADLWANRAAVTGAAFDAAGMHRTMSLSAAAPAAAAAVPTPAGRELHQLSPAELAAHATSSPRWSAPTPAAQRAMRGLSDWVNDDTGRSA
jgi:hypothetical protein